MWYTRDFFYNDKQVFQLLSQCDDATPTEIYQVIEFNQKLQRYQELNSFYKDITKMINELAEINLLNLTSLQFLIYVLLDEYKEKYELIFLNNFK